MRKEALILVASLIVSLFVLKYQSSVPANDQIFEQWQSDFGFSFTGEHGAYRQMVFLKNLQEIDCHNSNPLRSYDLGLNVFSHLTHEEFSAGFLNIALREDAKKKDILTVDTASNDIDWQKQGKVSVVKNQGACDAGYAFCTVSLVESYFLMKSQNLTLSEQQIVDCSASHTTFGCKGGSRAGTIDYVKEKGLQLDSKYAWNGAASQCKSQSGGPNKFNVAMFEANGCAQLESKLSNSPMTIAINAENIQSYKAGIYDGCTSTQVTHDIYLVGVTPTYWKLKNSWGVRWGETGYMRLKKGNTCGICEKPGFGFTSN